MSSLNFSVQSATGKICITFYEEVNFDDVTSLSKYLFFRPILTHSLFFSPSLSLSLFLALSLFLYHSFSRSLYHFFSRSLSITLSLYLSFTHSFSRALSLSLPLSLLYLHYSFSFLFLLLPCTVPLFNQSVSELNFFLLQNWTWRTAWSPVFKNLNFPPKLEFLAKIWISRQNLNFPPRFSRENSDAAHPLWLGAALPLPFISLCNLTSPFLFLRASYLAFLFRFETNYLRTIYVF